MTTLTGYVVNPALYREVGIEAQPGDQVEIYLDQEKVPGFPEFILGTIQNPVTTVCGGTSYSIEYDEGDLDGTGVEFIEGDDIVSVVVVSEARVLFAIEQAARDAGDADLQEQIDECVRFTDQDLSVEEAAVALANLKLASNGLVLFSRVTDAQTIVSSTNLVNTVLSAVLPTAGLWEIDLQFVLVPGFNVSNDSGGVKVRLNSADATSAVNGLFASVTIAKNSSVPFRTVYGLNSTLTLDEDVLSSGLNSYNILIQGVLSVSVAGTVTLQIAQKVAVSTLTIGVGGVFLARYLGNP
jgi:hypothetical protein